MQKQIPEIKSIVALIVQMSYFLFTCHVKGITILIGRQMVLLNPSRQQQQPQVAYEYLLSKDFNTFSKGEQAFAKERFVEHELGAKNPEAYGKLTLKYIGHLMSMARVQI